MLDPVLLRTFLVIAQGNSFSEASRKLAMRQSTVSDHVRRLEEALGRQLFVRDTHSVALTPEGEALIPFARSIIETSERAERHFAGTKLRGRVRFGASEDLVLTWLPSVLKTFVDDHPEIDLEFTIALSSTLIGRHEAGDLDIVICKRWPGDQRGEAIWHDEIVWAAGDGQPLVSHGHVPLILYPPPSMTRSMALAALGQSGANWRIICTSDTLSGVIAAAQAGLGVMVIARKLLPAGLHEVTPAMGLPPLGALDFIMLRQPRAPRAPVSELAAAITQKARAFD
jgi:DNA-binding transcriptional LysR family regulator